MCRTGRPADFERRFERERAAEQKRHEIVAPQVRACRSARSAAAIRGERRDTAARRCADRRRQAAGLRDRPAQSAPTAGKAGRSRRQNSAKSAASARRQNDQVGLHVARRHAGRRPGDAPGRAAARTWRGWAADQIRSWTVHRWSIKRVPLPSKRGSVPSGTARTSIFKPSRSCSSSATRPGRQDDLRLRRSAGPSRPP